MQESCKVSRTVRALLWIGLPEELPWIGLGSGRLPHTALVSHASWACRGHTSSVIRPSTLHSRLSALHSPLPPSSLA